MYSVARITAGDQLRVRDGQVAVESIGNVLVMLAVSENAIRDAISDPIRTAVLELASCVGTLPLDADEKVRRLLLEFEDMRKRSAFGRGMIPHGAFVVLSEDGLARVYRFGPVGAACLHDGQLALIHRDLRYPALRRLGVQARFLDEYAEKLIGSVEFAMTSLYEVPPAIGPVVQTPVNDAHSLVLMSRAVLPFEAPDQAEPIEVWAERDAGWRHGRGGVIVEICRRGNSKLSRATPGASLPTGLGLLG